MIPPRVLYELADVLRGRTLRGEAVWQRLKYDRQEYRFQLPRGWAQLRYEESRGGANSIELSVHDFTDEILGTVFADEEDARYDVLADLVFAVQRKLDANAKATTDEVIELINSERGAVWYPLE
jgi:hypothetical protein